MTAKEKFISDLKIRTKKFAVDVISFCETLITSKASSVVTYQIIKSATSIGANYRAACRARSRAEFFSKMCIVVEEADETEYWLEIIKDAKLSTDINTLDMMLSELLELIKIMSKAKNTVYKERMRE